MRHSMVPQNVVIIGAGIMGCSIALELAKAQNRVVIVERDPEPRSASWAAAGLRLPEVTQVRNSRLLHTLVGACQRLGVAVRCGEPVVGFEVRDGYVVFRNDDRVLVGSTLEDAGFDSSVTVQGLLDILQAASVILPSLRHTRLISSWAGLRPDTPDHLPLLGALSSPKGLFIATGHFRSGILMAPITGRVMAQLMTGRTPELDLTLFRPERFAPSLLPPPLSGFLGPRAPRGGAPAPGRGGGPVSAKDQWSFDTRRSAGPDLNATAP